MKNNIKNKKLGGAIKSKTLKLNPKLFSLEKPKSTTKEWLCIRKLKLWAANGAMPKIVTNKSTPHYINVKLNMVNPCNFNTSKRALKSKALLDQRVNTMLKTFKDSISIKKVHKKK